MDPALWELLRNTGRDDHEVEAIIRLDDPQVDVASVNIVSRFGGIATCRLRRDSILRVRRDDNVVSLKAPRTLGPESQPNDANSAAEPSLVPVDRDRRRPLDLPLTGARVCVGIVDWGCDFDHPNFKQPDGSTRLLALWDQRGFAAAGVPRPYGYGVVHSSADINDALRTADPYDALGYHAADADRDGSGAHGTFVMDIAAGNGLAGGPEGIAPDADLIFVHLADRGTAGLANLGDSVRILEAVDFIARTAGRRPWVINLSVGRHGGPHDGSTLTELAFDFALSAAPGRFIVQSTGNYAGKSCHASARLEPGQIHTLTLITNEDDVTPNELEVWYSGRDEFVVRIESPTGLRSPWVRLGERADVLEEERIVGRLYHRECDPNNFDNHIDLFLYPWAPAGPWVAILKGLRVRAGVFHAWIERDEFCAHCQAHFPQAEASNLSTTGTIANGRMPLVVGAYDAHSPARELAHFSSAGPTRDGRLKPELVAPGVHVLAARSAPPGSSQSLGMLTRKSGTSFAAPHVTGAVALCLQGAPRPLTGAEIRAILVRSAGPVNSNGDFSSRFGYGYLDVGNVVAAVCALGSGVRASRAAYRLNGAKRREYDSKEQQMPHESEHAARISLGPDKLYREVVYRRGGPVSAWIEEAFVVLARPGELPHAPPEAGDILVRVALGEPGLGHVAVLSDSTLTRREALDGARLSAEGEGPGLYATVVEGGAFPHMRSDRFARRVLNEAGRMPLGQVLLRPRPSFAVDLDPVDPDLEAVFEDTNPSPVNNLSLPTADVVFKTGSGRPDLGVTQRQLVAYDVAFRGKIGVSFKRLVEWAAGEVEINPGLLGVNLIAETRRGNYLSRLPVSSFVIGTDDFYDKRKDIAAKVSAYQQVKWNPRSRTTDINEKGRRVVSIQFDSGRDAALASAVNLKHGEVVLGEAAREEGADLDQLMIEVRFALVRLAFNAGLGRARKNLREALNGEDILVRRPPKEAGPQRRATVHAARAIHLSETVFGVSV
jgi:subtilisin family serine protease